jgi:hypothetical protein
MAIVGQVSNHLEWSKLPLFEIYHDYLNYSVGVPSLGLVAVRSRFSLEGLPGDWDWARRGEGQRTGRRLLNTINGT